jgi:hypothetical protein
MHRERAAMDILYIGLIVAFCALSAALIYGLEKLRERQ